MAIQMTEKSIQDTLAGLKIQTRRLAREGDYLDEQGLVRNKKGNLRWSRENAVQSGRGKRGLWYCPRCKRVYENPHKIDDLNRLMWCECYEMQPDYSWLEKLRIFITGIRKERLLRISETDAKKEGFKDRLEFLTVFTKINNKELYKKLSKGKEHLDGIGYFVHIGWNPKVWVLDFEVKK